MCVRGGVHTSIWSAVNSSCSGKLSREKTFANFMALWLFVKVFSVKFGDIVSFGTAKESNPWKFSPQKLYNTTMEGYMMQQ